MASIFSKIAAGEIPSYKCAESDKFYAFLDISPIGKGHTLVIPRKEVDYIFDMEDQDLAEFEVFAKKVAKAIKAAFPCKKVAQVVLGLEVPHAHIHLIPMNSEADVNFRKEHLKLSEEEYKLISFLNLYLVDILAHQRRGVFFATNQQHIVFLCHNKAIKAIQYS